MDPKLIRIAAICLWGCGIRLEALDHTLDALHTHPRASDIPTFKLELNFKWLFAY